MLLSNDFAFRWYLLLVERPSGSDGIQVPTSSKSKTSRNVKSSTGCFSTSLLGVGIQILIYCSATSGLDDDENTLREGIIERFYLSLSNFSPRCDNCMFQPLEVVEMLPPRKNIRISQLDLQMQESGQNSGDNETAVPAMNIRKFLASLAIYALI